MTSLRFDPSVLITVAPAVSALAALVIVIYAMRTMRLTKQLEKVRLTLAQLDSPDFKNAAAALHTFLKAHSYDLQTARAAADQGYDDWAACTPDCAIETTFVTTFHPITHLSTLYERNYLDQNTILDRFALLFARWYFVFYTYLETMQVMGDQTKTALALGRDSCDEVRRRPSSLFADHPELRDFTIPAAITARNVRVSTLEAIRRARKRRGQATEVKISTAGTSTAAS